VWKSIIHALYTDFFQRGGFDLGALIDNGQLTTRKEPCGMFTLTSPSQFKDTWQLATANPIVNLLDPHQ
jgi:hypothetical protein